jgi:lactam utilization protein B
MNDPSTMTLEYLADRHLDGQSTPAERDQLNALLRRDEAARDRFVSLCIEARVLRESLAAVAEVQSSKFNVQSDSTPTLSVSASRT